MQKRMFNTILKFWTKQRAFSFLCLLFVLVVSKKTKDESAIKQKLKAYIHIGPHKTGTTHFQEYLEEVSAFLEKEGYRQVQQHVEEITATAAANDVNGKHHTKIEGAVIAPFLEKAVTHNYNVIYSAEALHTLTKSEIDRLKEMFRDFSVTIVTVYRESLARELSSFNSRTRRYEQTGSILEYLSEYLTNVHRRDTTALDNYSRVFGRENIVAADYYGIVETGKDEAYVLLCEIMGVVCKEAASLNYGGASHENHAEDLTLAQVLDAVIVYAQYMGHDRPRMGVMSSMAEIVQASLDELAASQKKMLPPKRHVLLSALAPLSKLLDDDFRKQYGDILLYPNPSAGDLARDQILFDEVDTAAMLANPIWRDWMHDMYDTLKKKGFF